MSDSTSKISNSDGLPVAIEKNMAGIPNEAERSRSGKWLKLGIGALLIVAAGLATALYFDKADSTDDSSPEPISTPTTTRGTFALGRLEPLGEIVAVAAPSGAGDSRIESLNVAEGDEVATGDILAVLDNEKRLAAAVEVAEKSVQQAHASLEKTQVEVSSTVSQLKAALNTAKARLKTVETKFDRYQSLVDSGGVSRETFEEVELDANVNRQEIDEAQARLDRYQLNADGDSVDVALAQANVAVAESSLTQARENLNQAYVRAPSDGTVLKIELRPGERVGQVELLEMGDTGQMMTRVEVYESDVANLKPGQSATLSAAPLADELTGKIDRISTLVQKQKIVDADPAANTDARVVEVWVCLDSESSKRAKQFVNLQVRAHFLP